MNTVMKNANFEELTILYLSYYESPIGILQINATEENITQVLFVASKTTHHSRITPILKQCEQQLDEYFGQERQEFELPIRPVGTPFQLSVWEELKKVPYGSTCSYQEIAKRIRNPRAVRAVGSANGKNPIAIIIPCHRIIGAHGQLVGYGGGLWRKEWLLRHEKNLLVS